ncbi:uncharacterized protein LOC122070355 isoform X3 [Macadamia integrifolia]|nr:uncharacterized protein LOC122070355 isoform X3 [Macadamia integrifolia]
MMIESAAATELVGCERKGNVEEPYVGMEFESEEAAKMFYDAYATHMGFVMRFDAFRRSLRDGKVICRRLVCNKEGFRRVRPRQSENRKPRAITREGCKAMVMVKREKTGKWVVSRFVKDHNHPMVISSGSSRRSLLLSQTPFRGRSILLRGRHQVRPSLLWIRLEKVYVPRNREHTPTVAEQPTAPTLHPDPDPDPSPGSSQRTALEGCHD